MADHGTLKRFIQGCRCDRCAAIHEDLRPARKIRPDVVTYWKDKLASGELIKHCDEQLQRTVDALDDRFTDRESSGKPHMANGERWWVDHINRPKDWTERLGRDGPPK